jgi:hypothetical protein
MTGANNILMGLIVWCGGNNVLLSACEFGIGLGGALLFGYICFSFSKLVVSGNRFELSSWHATLLFACGFWGYFLALLSGRLQTLTMGLPAIQVVLIAGTILAPISTIAGIPFLVYYLIRKPVLRARTIYIVAALNLALSLLYLVRFNVAFDGSS